MARNLRRKLAIAGAALAAVAAGGGAYAATHTGTNPRQAFLNDAAKRLGVSPKRLSSALTAATIDRLNAAVKAGKLTQAQANAIERRIQMHGGVPPVWFGHRGMGRDRLGPRGFFRPMRPGMGGPGMLGPGTAPHGPLAAAAGYLGLSQAQLFKQLSSGKSLAQVAQAQHKSVAGLQKVVQSELKARLDRAVKAGVLNKKQEARILSRMSAIVTRKIERPGFGPRFRGMGGHHQVMPPAGGPPASLVPGPPPPVVY